MKETLAGVGMMAAVVLLVAALSFGGFTMYQYFKPKYVAVDYKTFKESQQYRDGMAQRLEQYQEAYDACRTTACRSNIVSMVKHDFASYDEQNLPSQLRTFYEKMVAAQ